MFLVVRRCKTPLRLWAAGLLALLAGCASERAPDNGSAVSPEEARAFIEQALPSHLSDRAGWVNDIYSGFTVQGLQPTRQNVCAVVAVIEQESNFRVNPVVPGLGAKAWKEIDTRAEHAGVPRMLVHAALELR